jgi:hypothetical protein
MRSGAEERSMIDKTQGFSWATIRRFEVDAMAATDSLLPNLRKLINLDEEQAATVRTFVHGMIFAAMRGKAANEVVTEQVSKTTNFVNDLLDSLELTDEQYERVTRFCNAAHERAASDSA